MRVASRPRARGKAPVQSARSVHRLELRNAQFSQLPGPRYGFRPIRLHVSLTDREDDDFDAATSGHHNLQRDGNSLR